MPTYRVYYAERMPRGAEDWMRTMGHHRWGAEDQKLLEHEEVEWEEEVEARTATEALDSFFREHVADQTHVKWVDERGDVADVEGIGGFDSEITYIWIEDDKLMEYQGMDEATPGMVTCPLCGGEGEVDEAAAEEYLADQEEGEEEVTWG